MNRLGFPAAVWRRIWRDAAVVVAVAICVARATGLAWTEGWDFHAYYAADFGRLYVGSAPGAPGAFLYSPVFAQLLEPLRWLPYNISLALWTALELGCLIYIAGPWSLLAFLPLAPEWMNGNVHILMAAAVYAGVRGPAPLAWTVPAFTKLAPAVGLAWFGFRGEWRNLARTLALIAVVSGASVLLAPDLWIAWAQMLQANIGAAGLPGSIDIPLLTRLPFAVALIAWGGRTNRPWTVPVACALAMPTFWYSATTAFGIAALRLAHVPNPFSVLARLARVQPRAETATSLATVPAVVGIES